MSSYDGETADNDKISIYKGDVNIWNLPWVPHKIYTEVHDAVEGVGKRCSVYWTIEWSNLKSTKKSLVSPTFDVHDGSSYKLMLYPSTE